MGLVQKALLARTNEDHHPSGSKLTGTSEDNRS